MTVYLSGQRTSSVNSSFACQQCSAGLMSGISGPAALGRISYVPILPPDFRSCRPAEGIKPAPMRAQTHNFS